MKKIGINSKNFEIVLNSYLYNAEFKPENINYSDETGNLDIVFKRIYFEDFSKVQKIKILPFLIIFKYPKIKSSLHIECVKECQWDSFDNSIKYHKFDACIIRENICYFFFNTLFEMHFKIADNLKGYLEDKHIIINERKKYFSFFSKNDFFHSVREKIQNFEKENKGSGHF